MQEESQNNQLEIKLRGEQKGQVIKIDDFRIFGDSAPLFSKEIQIYKVLQDQFADIAQSGGLGQELLTDPTMQPIVEKVLKHQQEINEKIDKEKDKAKKAALKVELEIAKNNLEQSVMDEVLKSPSGIATIVKLSKETNKVDIQALESCFDKIVKQEIKLVKIGWEGIDKEDSWPKEIMSCLTTKTRYKFIEYLIREEENQINQDFLSFIPNTKSSQDSEKSD